MSFAPSVFCLQTVGCGFGGVNVTVLLKAGFESLDTTHYFLSCLSLVKKRYFWYSVPMWLGIGLEQSLKKMPPLSVNKRSEVLDNVDRAAEVFSKYGDFILATIRYQAKNNDQVQADDIFQNFFLSLVSKPIPADVQNTQSYLYRAITNDVIDAVRQESKYRARMQKYAECHNYPINKSSPENALIEIEEINKLFKLIEKRLPYNEALAVTLRYENSCNTAEIAEKIGVKPRTVSRYISIGLKKIRRVFNINKGGNYDNC
jgi:RNA polymerase sigma factor (sigma-70 family)